MSTNHTQNYQLSLWEATDKVQRTEFNENHAKIDAALAALEESKASTSALSSLRSDLTSLRGQVPKIAVGSYTGNGAATRTISVGFTPKAVYVCAQWGATQTSASPRNRYGGLAVTGSPCMAQSLEIVAIVTNGFRVDYLQTSGAADCTSNMNGQTYNYLAVG